MAVVTIGKTTNPFIISDNATPANGIYAWYIPAASVKRSMAFPWATGTRKNGPSGVSTGAQQYILDEKYTITRAPITSSTDYENWQKAIRFWSADDRTLYVSFTVAGWNYQVAKVATYTNITLSGGSEGAVTLSQFQGKLTSLSEDDWTSDTVHISAVIEYINT